MKDNDFPFLSIIIVTKNVERTLPKLIKSFEMQTYPRKKMEILIIDGRSTDATLEIIKKSKLEMIVHQGKYPNDPEVCKGEGLRLSKGEIVGLIDSDNYLPHKNWLKKMVHPLMDDREIVGSYTWRFAYRKNDAILNRYFSLIGSADPVGLYLKKADKLSYISDKWLGFGRVHSNNSKYFIVEFDKENFPTLGSNGFFARKEYLVKGEAVPKKFFHIDVPYDILKLNLNKYAVVKDVIIHDTAGSFMSFLKKRSRYMQLHYQKRSKDRRYFVFNPNRNRDVIRLILFVLFSITFIQPLYVSFRGFMRIKDIAWFVHPVFCFSIAATYSNAMFGKFLKERIKI